MKDMSHMINSISTKHTITILGINVKRQLQTSWDRPTTKESRLMLLMTHDIFSDCTKSCEFAQRPSNSAQTREGESEPHGYERGLENMKFIHGEGREIL